MAKINKKRQNRPSDVSAGEKRVKTHNWDKDATEVDLEAKLFGSSRVGKKGKGKKARRSGEETGLGGVDDDDLFEVDAPVAEVLPSEDEDEDLIPGTRGEVAAYDHGESEEVDYEEESDVGSSSGSSSGSGSGSDDDSGSDSDSGESIVFEDTQAVGVEDEVAGAEQGVAKKKKKGEENDEPVVEFPADLDDTVHNGGKRRKTATVWKDESDAAIRVDIGASRLLRKLGRGKDEAHLSGTELEKKLREQFETLHPRPEWASNRTTSGTPSLRALLSSTKSFISTKAARPLAQNNLELRRLVNANHQNPTANRRAAKDAGKGVVDVAWHPSSKVGVMAVAGGDRRVRFFNIDGHTNSTLLTIHLPSLPLTSSTFHPSGSTLLLAGTRPYYYTYDLPSARCIRSPRNLFGSSISPSTPNSLTRHAFSPDGSMLAVAGRRGAVSILDWSGIGVGAVIAELKSGRGGAVVAMTWSRDSKELSVLGGVDACSVEVWDVAERKVLRKWRDDRAFGGTTMKVSGDGQYTAIGSTTGIVNLYTSSSLSPTSADASEFLTPEPLKSLEHLTTPICTTAFHPSSEIFMSASNTRKNQLKAYHLPSATAFANWPTPTTPLARVTNVSFNPGGEFMAMGNERGLVLLYSLKHYSRS